MRFRACVMVLAVLGAGLPVRFVSAWTPPEARLPLAGLAEADVTVALKTADALLRLGPDAAAAAPAVFDCIERLAGRTAAPVQFAYDVVTHYHFRSPGSSLDDQVLHEQTARIASVLPHLGERGMELAAAALEHRSLRVRWAMFTALRHGFGSHGGDMLPLALRVGAHLDDPDRSVRLLALAALGALPHHPAVTPAMAALTHSPDDELALAARDAVWFAGPIAREVKLTALVRPGVSEKERLHAATSLPDDHAALEAAAPVIRAALASHLDDAWTRVEGGKQFRSWTEAQRTDVFGAGALEVPPRSVPHVRGTTALDDFDAFGLALPDPPDRPADAARLADLRTRLRSDDRIVRTKAAEEASHIGPTAAPLIPELAANLKVLDVLPRIGLPDRADEPGSHAAEALKRIGKAAVPALERAAGDRDPFTRGLALGALRYMGKLAAPALPVITRCLTDPRASLRDAALRTVGTAADAAVAVAAARRALADPDRVARGSAVHVLTWHLPAPGALAGLYQAAADPDPYVASEAREALARVPPVLK